MLTVIEDIRVSEIVDKEQASYPRLEEAFDALKWWLARSPSSGEIIDDVHWLYKQKGDARQNIPAIVVIYIYNSYCVEIQFVLLQIPTL
jgi:hypothetical protein